MQIITHPHKIKVLLHQELPQLLSHHELQQLGHQELPQLSHQDLTQLVHLDLQQLIQHHPYMAQPNLINPTSLLSIF